jgi:hypothetical protein
MLRAKLGRFTHDLCGADSHISLPGRYMIDAKGPICRNTEYGHNIEEAEPRMCGP